jgi:hypothetical protein
MGEYTAKLDVGVLSMPATFGRTPVAIMTGRHGKQAADEPCHRPQPNERKILRPGPLISRLSRSDSMNKRTQILSMVAVRNAEN